jgi:hypothetical protein
MSRRHRTTLPPPEARQRYREIGGLAALDKIIDDARALDAQPFAIGPFARVDASEVAERDGKTRGAITNLFGSQAAYQAEVMSLVLDAETTSDIGQVPDPAAFERAQDWVDAFFLGQSREGPQHRTQLESRYAALWVLWLGTVPYGLWSDRIAGPSMDEFRRRVGQIEAAFAAAIDRFGLRLRDGVSLTDLACAAASQIEGVWLNQCLTGGHPMQPDQPTEAALIRAGRLLWTGAIDEAPTEPNA